MNDVQSHPERLSSVADQILQWLLSPSLSHPSGALAAWRSRATGKLAFEYPEITGYFLTCVSFAGEAARPTVSRSADWLSGRVEAGDHSARPGSDTIYSFDLAIIATGLLNVGLTLRSDRYISAGLHLAKRLADEILSSGRLAATSPPRSTDPKWSTLGQAHLLKCVQCLCLADEQGIDRMKEAAAVLVSSVGEVTLDSPDLALGETGPNLHATCYAIEGLWIWSSATGDQKAARRARGLLDVVETVQLPSGGFPKDLGTNRLVEQSDVSAQVARLRILLKRDDMVPSATLRRLVDIAVPSPGGMAIPYQPETKQLDENAWCSMFAYQALRLAQSSQPLSWRSLV